jgi:hypothetical protein
MTYDLVYSETVQNDLAKVPLGLLDAVEAQLLHLCRHPASLSRPSKFPYPLGYQLYAFDLYDLEGKWHRYTVLFKYGACERLLHIAMIGHVEYAD